MKQLPTQKVQAPEIYGDFWFNSSPLTVNALHGQVILLCFWDYTSESSIELLKLVQEWFLRYEEMGLVVIGIHSPEFSFARDPKFVEASVHRLGLRFPVATDNTLMVRNAYRVQEIPAIYLIERDGGIYFSHAGEGSYERTERAIQSLLREAGFHGELPLLMELSGGVGFLAPSFQRATPMIRTGYIHGSLGNVEGYSPELPAEYSDTGFYVEGRFYAQGNWLARNDAFEYEGATEEGYATLRYQGQSVSVVIAARKKGSIVRVLHDGKPLQSDNAGQDISFDELGNTFVVVNEPKLFHIVQNKTLGDHTMRIIPMEKGISLFSFTFGAGPSPMMDGIGDGSYRNN